MTEIVIVLFLRADESMSEGNAPKGGRLWDESTEGTRNNKRPITLGDSEAAHAQLSDVQKR